MQAQNIAKSLVARCACVPLEFDLHLVQGLTLAHGDSAAHPGVLKQGVRRTLVLIQAAVRADVVEPVPEATVTEWIFISLTKPDPICFWMEKSY